jgi:uncharacterized tellurite resistance protein B-like protein
MSIVMALVALLGGVLGLLWRMNAAADATRNIAETAGDIANLKRRWSWRRKAAQDPLLLIDDPRMAAVTMMTAIAQSDGALSERERAIILREAVKHFGCDAKAAAELLSYARFVLADRRDATTTFLKLKPLIQKRCVTEERRQLVAMLRAVAAADGEPGTAETHAIDLFRQDLG